LTGLSSNFLVDAAAQILATADPLEKVRLSAIAAEGWSSGSLLPGGVSVPPDRPARPPQPQLLSP